MTGWQPLNGPKANFCYSKWNFVYEVLLDTSLHTELQEPPYQNLLEPSASQMMSTATFLVELYPIKKFEFRCFQGSALPPTCGIP